MKKAKNKNNPYSDMSAKQLKVLAEQGDAEAQFKLAGRYKKGEGIKRILPKPLSGTAKLQSKGILALKTTLAYATNRGEEWNKTMPKL